jgi:TolA-binding protein
MKKFFGLLSLGVFVSVVAVTSVFATNNDTLEQLKNKLLSVYDQSEQIGGMQKKQYKNLQQVHTQLTREQQIQKLEEMRNK